MCISFLKIAFKNKYHLVLNKAYGRGRVQAFSGRNVSENKTSGRFACAQCPCPRLDEKPLNLNVQFLRFTSINVLNKTMVLHCSHSVPKSNHSQVRSEMLMSQNSHCYEDNLSSIVLEERLYSHTVCQIGKIMFKKVSYHNIYDYRIIR